MSSIADEALSWRKRDVIIKHIKIVEGKLDLLKEHPITVEFYLRLAYYYLVVDNIDKANKYFKLFKKK